MATQISTCSISLLSSDRIRLTDVTGNLVDGFRQTILQSWAKGIQKEELAYGFPEFKLKGNPWNWNFGKDEDIITSKFLLVSLLGYMGRNGWNLLGASTVLLCPTMFFELKQPDPDILLFSISLAYSDRIRVIGAPPGITDIVRQTVMTHWPKGIQTEHVYYGCEEMKLVGSPWDVLNNEARLLLNQLMFGIHATTGFKLYSSISFARGGYYDNWFFRKVTNVWK